MIYNTSGTLQINSLWYDYPEGRNFNIIRRQLGKHVYDLEWNNGTSFIYALDPNKKCKTLKFDAGILTPNFLDGANYSGQQKVLMCNNKIIEIKDVNVKIKQKSDGFLCNVWEKIYFILYYEDVVTKRPVHWVFYNGMEAHLMTFKVGAVLEDEKWQAPIYCFESGEHVDDSPELNSAV
ncbi:hypothetical protein MKX01_007689 [Papaver californicum]|nr:hypothetical protein MKX01_007689 [Papaver californicum]